MAGFSEKFFVKKLEDLNNSSQSIQTLSLWLIHHRKHHEDIVKIWYRELLISKDTKKLTFMYLANDVIQNSIKKGPEFGKEFGLYLKKTFKHLGDLTDNHKMRGSLDRLLKVWQERVVYSKSEINDFRELLFGEVTEPPAKKAKTSKKPKSEGGDKKEKDDSEDTNSRTPEGDPPEPEELIHAIQNLENNTASADEAARRKISSLPSEVSEVSLLSKITDKAAAEALSAQVDDAIKLLNDYNTRLSKETECRKIVSTMLRDFLISQKELLVHAEKCLEEYQEKYQKTYKIRQDLRNHVQNLPDLTQLPDVTVGLGPLPSAGDLFNFP